MPRQNVKTRKPLTAEQKKYFLIGGIVAAVIVLLLVIYGVVNATVFSPNKVAQSYLSSISSGEFNKANGYAKSTLNSDQSVMLSDKAVNKDGLIHDPHITRTTSNADGSKRVQFSYTLSGKNNTDSLTINSEGRKFLLFSNWQITTPLTQHVNLEVPKTVESIKLNGITISDKNTVKAEGTDDLLEAGDRLMSIVTYPGTYTVKADEAGYLTSKDQTVASQKDDSFLHTITAKPVKLTPTDKLKNEINAQIKTKIDQCATSNQLNPKDCLFDYGIDDPDYKNIKWSVTKYPSLDDMSRAFDLFDNSFTADVDGQMKVDYDFDIGDGDPIHDSSNETVYVSGTYKIVNGKVQLDFDTN